MVSESVQAKLRAASACDIRFDRFTRELYATDASIYQITPLGIAIPKSSEDALRALEIAADEGVAILPRGAGTSQCGPPKPHRAPGFRGTRTGQTPYLFSSTVWTSTLQRRREAGNSGLKSTG